MADANFNIVGVVTNAGQLVERYEYTPYGQRTVYSHGWYIADMNMDGEVDTADYDIWADEMMGGGSAHSIADLNGDGSLTQADYTVWADSAMAGDGSPSADPLVSYPRTASFRNVDASTNLSHTPLCEFGHQGKMHDERIGLKENAARVYNPRLGRWMQRDPLNQNMPGGGYHDGMNLYQMLRGNPLRYLDPFGTDLWTENTTSVGGWHRRACVDTYDADGNKKGKYCISFGMADADDDQNGSSAGSDQDGGSSDSDSSDEGGSSDSDSGSSDSDDEGGGNSGSGIVYVDMIDPATHEKQRKELCPSDTRKAEAYMRELVGNRGEYHWLTCNCRGFADTVYDIVVEDLENGERINGEGLYDRNN